MQLERISGKCGVVYMHGVSRHPYLRCSVKGSNLYLLLLRGVVVHPPQSAAAGVVVPVCAQTKESEVPGGLVYGEVDAGRL